MNHYIEVLRAAFEAFLWAKGFRPGRSGNEMTYTRLHERDQRLSVVVYTSCPADARLARGSGEDAIRVVALFKWNAYGEERCKKLYGERVFRVNSLEGVFERTLDHMRKAYQACNDYRKELRHP